MILWRNGLCTAIAKFCPVLQYVHPDSYMYTQEEDPCNPWQFILET